MKIISRFEIDDLRVLNWPSFTYHIVITKIQQLFSISAMVTTISISSGVGNDGEVTMLNFARFVLLKQVNIGTNALNGVKELIATNLTQLNSMNVGEDSLTNIEK